MDIPDVYEISFGRIDTAQGGEMSKEQQLTSNQSITIDNCMMVTLHRSKSQMLGKMLSEIKLPLLSKEGYG